MKDIQLKINHISAKLNIYLRNFFLNMDGVQKDLREAMEYSINSGGKRLRPCILVLFYEIFGGNSENIYNIAMAIEMIHTYSLIHDDLPCMDNDETRRGKKCTHVVYGEDMALLAGDAFITQAFELIMSDDNIRDFGEKSIISATKELAYAAGSCGMVSGQALDINISNYDHINEDLVLNMYKNKTGRLFSVAARIGAIFSKTNEKLINLSGEYGENLGIAFQLYDDIIDISNDESGKITYVSCFGKDKARDKAAYFTDQSIKNAEEFGENGILLSELSIFLSTRGI